MNYLASNHNTLIWFWFITYAITIIFLIPDRHSKKDLIETAEAENQRALNLASKMVLRTILILPMLLLLKNAV